MRQTLTLANDERRWALAIIASAHAICGHTHRLVSAKPSRFRIIPPPDNGDLKGRLVFVFRRCPLGRRTVVADSHVTAYGADLWSDMGGSELASPKATTMLGGSSMDFRSHRKRKAHR